MRRGGVDDVNTTLTNPGKEGRPGVADPVQDAAPTVDLVSKDLDRHEARLGFLWLAGEVVEMAGDDEVPPAFKANEQLDTSGSACLSAWDSEVIEHHHGTGHRDSPPTRQRCSPVPHGTRRFT